MISQQKLQGRLSVRLETNDRETLENFAQKSGLKSSDLLRRAIKDKIRSWQSGEPIIPGIPAQN